jgi:hypothetical protein
VSDLGLSLLFHLGGHHSHEFGGGGGSCHWQCIPLTLTFKCVTPRPCFGSHHFPRFLPNCIYSAVPANGSPRSRDNRTYVCCIVVAIGECNSGASSISKTSRGLNILNYLVIVEFRTSTLLNKKCFTHLMCREKSSINALQILQVYIERHQGMPRSKATTIHMSCMSCFKTVSWSHCHNDTNSM